MAADFVSAVGPVGPFLVAVATATSAVVVVSSDGVGQAGPAFLLVVVLVVETASLAVVFWSEDLLVVVGNVEAAAEIFALGSNESFVLAALEVFVALLLLLAPFALLLLLLLWPPPVRFVITGALWTNCTWGWK